MGMTYKEGKTQDSRKGSNLFYFMIFWVSDIQHDSNSENSLSIFEIYMIFKGWVI